VVAGDAGAFDKKQLPQTMRARNLRGGGQAGRRKPHALAVVLNQALRPKSPEPPVHKPFAPVTLGENLLLLNIRPLRQMWLAQFVQSTQHVLAADADSQPDLREILGHHAAARREQQ
jgi:hypothetical protein